MYIYIYIYIYIYTQNPPLIYNISSDKERLPNWKRRDEIVTLSCQVIKKGARTHPVLSHGKNGSNPFGQPKFETTHYHSPSLRLED